MMRVFFLFVSWLASALIPYHCWGVESFHLHGPRGRHRRPEHGTIRSRSNSNGSSRSWKSPVPVLNSNTALGNTSKNLDLTAAAAAAATVVRNAGDASVFNNANMGISLFHNLRNMLRVSPSPTLVASLTAGLDELAGIGVYLLVINRILHTIWHLQTQFRPRKWWWKQNKNNTNNNNTSVMGGTAATTANSTKQAYQRSLLGYIQAPARTLGYSMFVVWCLDVMVVIIRALDPSPVRLHNTQLFLRVASIIVYSNVWGRFFAALKNYYIEITLTYPARRPSFTTQTGKPPLTRAQRAFARRSSGIVLWMIMFVVCAEGVALATGLSLQSIFSFAGVGGLALGLATKDLLSNLVGGAMLFLTSPFIERDKISMTGLDQCRIRRIGLYKTEVIGDDEQVQYIPNARFISNKISNRQRRSHRVLKEQIYLTHEVLPTAETFLTQLSTALVSQPTVDTAGRPFRVYVKNITQTAVVVEIEVHFFGNDGTEYRNKRSKALLRVAQVVAEHDGANFAIFASLLGIPAEEKTTRIENEDEAMTTMQQQLNLDTA